MYNCPKCGVELQDTDTACQACGWVKEEPAAEAEQATAAASVLDTSDRTAEFDPADMEKNKIWAILGFIFPVLFFVPLVIDGGTSKYGRWLANQQLIIFVASLILSMISCGILGIVALVFQIMGIVYAVQGKAKDLPLISKLEIIKLEK
ncbi:MAG: hypothetical protein IJY82_06300 [Oscillospiraceae bacterium]|nr:hypothetical protein [Oscillospiraceae bacterium]